MSHHDTPKDARDSTSYERAIANLIAGVILGIGRMVHAIFKTTFQILEAIVGILS